MYKHLNDPYPTAYEKQELAKMSGLSVAQVKTWFANARRRSKRFNLRKISPPSPYDYRSYGVPESRPYGILESKPLTPKMYYNYGEVPANYCISWNCQHSQSSSNAVPISE